jgi:cysteine synthase
MTREPHPGDGICDSVLDTVGHTPLIRMQRVVPAGGPVQLLAKHEGYNPTGSVKARIIAAMLDDYERRGRLRPAMTLVEASSGNTGIALAMAAAVKGYRCTILMGKRLSRERRQMIRAFGAELILIDGGTDEAWAQADAMVQAEPDRYFRFHQYESEENWRAHYRTTGPELWRQTGGRLDVLVATLGTTGTLLGAARYLKEQNPALRVVSVEPDSGRSRQQGIRNLTHLRLPPFWDPAIADERRLCRDDDAFAHARRLALEEGIFAGISAGSALWAALDEVRRLARGTVVFIVPDGGEKYLTTELFAFSDDPAVNAPLE